MSYYIRKLLLAVFLCLISISILGQVVSSKKCKTCGRIFDLCEYHGNHPKDTTQPSSNRKPSENKQKKDEVFVTFASNAQGAQLTIDGIEIGTSESNIKLKSGKHILSAIAVGFKSFVDTIMVNVNNHHFEIDMEPDTIVPDEPDSVSVSLPDKNSDIIMGEDSTSFLLKGHVLGTYNPIEAELYFKNQNNNRFESDANGNFAIMVNPGDTLICHDRKYGISSYEYKELVVNPDIHEIYVFLDMVCFCRMCNDSRKCRLCSGKGKTGKEKCLFCNGSGSCNSCRNVYSDPWDNNFAPIKDFLLSINVFCDSSMLAGATIDVFDENNKRTCNKIITDNTGKVDNINVRIGYKIIINCKNYLTKEISIDKHFGKSLYVYLERNSMTPSIATTKVGYQKNYKENADLFYVNGVDFVMVNVKGGTFTMGATSEQGKDASSDEKPAHKVKLTDFAIGETEVTQSLWFAVMGKTIQQQESNATESFALSGVGSNYPVYYVSFEDCCQFVDRLNVLFASKLGKRRFSIPTEAQWEYAARGGNKGKQYKYAGDNLIDKVAWYEANSSDHVHLVKEKNPNQLGLYDMSGNVSEWCLDNSHRVYSDNLIYNPLELTMGSHVIRGGSWHSIDKYCKVSCRDGAYTTKHSVGSVGFRICIN